jgi:hypothetical protein
MNSDYPPRPRIVSPYRSTPRFEGECECELLPDGRNVRIEKSMTFIDVRGRKWIAPAGRVSDGASIPPLLWPFIGGPFEGKHRRAALFHDAAYAKALSDKLVEAIRSRRRAQADRMLYEAALLDGTPLWKARLIYFGVRIGGGFAWRANAKRLRAQITAEITGASR